MARMTASVGLLLLCFAMSISAAAQSSAATAPGASRNLRRAGSRRAGGKSGEQGRAHSKF